MNWKSIQENYPGQWILAEAVEAHSEPGKRMLDELAVVDAYPDSLSAMRGYKTLHKKCPSRELYVLHTDRTDLSAEERRWGRNQRHQMNALCEGAFRFLFSNQQTWKIREKYMTAVEAIEREIEQLSPKELAEFRRWFVTFDGDAWDAQIEDDAAAGKLDALAEEAMADYEAGKALEI